MMAEQRPLTVVDAHVDPLVGPARIDHDRDRQGQATAVDGQVDLVLPDASVLRRWSWPRAARQASRAASQPALVAQNDRTPPSPSIRPQVGSSTVTIPALTTPPDGSMRCPNASSHGIKLVRMGSVGVVTLLPFDLERDRRRMRDRSRRSLIVRVYVPTFVVGRGDRQDGRPGRRNLDRRRAEGPVAPAGAPVTAQARPYPLKPLSGVTVTRMSCFRLARRPAWSVGAAEKSVRRSR